MGPDIDAARVTYRSNVELALQEQNDQFSPYFSTIGEATGKLLRVVDLVSDSEAREDAPEGGETPNIEANHEPVWVRPKRFDWGVTLKVENQIKALTDFKSTYVQGGVAAIVRKRNVFHANCLFGNRLIGSEVPVSTAWAGSTVPVDLEATGTPSRMSVRKILNGIRLMKEAFIEVGMEQIVIAGNAQQNEELYQDITFTSKDYINQSVFEGKQVKSFMGMPFIDTQRITQFDASTWQAAMFCVSGMWKGSAWPLNVKAQENPNREFREQVYIEEWDVCTRSEDKKVVKILTKK